MRAPFISVAVALGLLLSSGGAAQAPPPPEDADMPIAFTSAVTDVCFQMAYQNTISLQARMIIDPLPHAPVVARGLYPRVPIWYRLRKEPRSIFIGMGDKPNLCHVLLADSKDGRQSFSALLTLLRATGFTGRWDSRGTAVVVLTRKWGTTNLLLILKGLTDATDGVGPQVSVDIGSASDAELTQLLGGK